MDEALYAALRSGARTASELCATLQISQPTLSRMLRSVRRQIAILGRGRSTRYGLYRRIRDLPPELPIHRVSTSGEIEQIATLISIAPDRYWFEDAKSSANSREFTALPWFMADMRPQGFLGRLFPLRYDDLELPSSINHWSEDHALYAIARRGEELAGNLIVGEESHARWLALARGAGLIQPNTKLESYAQLARSTLEGRVAGSSAAGEQPKFTAEVGGDGGGRHVIVKFSPPLDTSLGQRWSDLLVAEHLASEILRAHGQPAAQTTYLCDGTRAYLEIERFDRVGLAGRIGMVSLGALDDEFVGERVNWSQSAAGLLRAGLIDAEEARRVRWLAAFGALIANTDMHHGNISFLHDGGMRLRLAPSYDMLPMLYSPARHELAFTQFQAPLPKAGVADQWPAARPVAVRFWEMLGEDQRVSSAFRDTARENARLI